MKGENCRDLFHDLSNYLDNEAAAQLCEEIEQHIGCDKCRTVVDTLHKTITLYRRLPQPNIPEQARERLYKILNLSGYL